jgi:acetate---CoA ligase (ADP-forming)
MTTIASAGPDGLASAKGGSGAGTDGRAAARPAADLGRVLTPATVAIVGLSDTSHFADYIAPTLDSDAEVFMVNPRYQTVLGYPAYPTLTAIGRPIDVVMTVMSAERTTQLVEEAAGLDVGGLVLIAGGFAETGPAGAVLQQRLAAAAGGAGMGIVGPNGLGYINVPHRISLTIASRHKRRPGGISVVSQSGAMLSGVAMASWDRRGTGLNLLVSAGNEAVTDLADYVDYLAADPETRAIGLIIEKVRRPEAFFAAVRRAIAANKPVVALKLGRNPRSRQMAASHTGALTGDAWVYDVAFAQEGIQMVRDPEEMVERLSLFEQLEPTRWSRVEKLGVITMTGGFASLCVDIAAEESVALPALESEAAWVRENLPGIVVPNPLDTTGLGGALWPQIVARYAASADLDALMYVHPLADEDASPMSSSLVDEFITAATTNGKPAVISNCAGASGSFVTDRVTGSGGVALGHGLRATLRGLAALGSFVRYRQSTRDMPDSVPPLPRPAAAAIPVPEGAMLPFAAAMELLRGAGIPVAPYALVPSDAAAVPVPAFGGPYVVKLADVGHRTEHGAVRLGVPAPELAAAVQELRAIAAADGLPPLVAIQPMLAARGEVFLGIQGDSELGPLVVFGLGGVLVEVLRRVGGRLAPLTLADAESLVAEFADAKVMHGFRGQQPWDLPALARILVAAGRLAAGGAGWIGSLDVNPLLYTGDGFVAVDALCLLRD